MALNTIHGLYKFYYTHPANGQVQCYPANNSIEFVWKKNKDQVFFRKELNTTLRFTKDDFNGLYNIDRSNYRCEKIFFEIHRRNGIIYELFWSGYIALIDADFDVDHCVITVKPRLTDDYSCLFEKYNKEKDFISGVGAPSPVNPVRLTLGNVEFTYCVATVVPIFDPDTQTYTNPDAYPVVSDCLGEPVETWLFVQNNIISIDLELLGGFCTYQSFYSREVATGTLDGLGTPIPPIGTGWVYLATGGLGSVWARPTSYSYDLAGVTPLQNGRKLTDVLQYLVDDCDLTIVSDFFNKNPDATAPDNIPYQYATDNFSEIIIFQKSDIRRTKQRIIDGDALDVQYATKALIKLKNLLDQLKTIFNVAWTIENGNLRIEHITYFEEGGLMLDLTKSSLVSYIKGQHKYKYKYEDLPVKETWKWMEESDINGDFDGLPIDYESQCSYDNEGNEIEYQSDKITTNIEFIILQSDKISDAGFVLASTLAGSLVSSTGLITGYSKINMPLSWANLHYYLHRYGRPQKTGNMNGNDETFYLTNKTRQQDGINFKISDDDLAIFDPIDRVKTQLGWGEVEQAVLTDPQNILKLTLIHD